MKYEERKHIIDTLGYVEENFPVHLWQVDSIDIWPILKVNIWFSLANEDRKKYKKPLPFHKKSLKSIIVFLRRIKDRAIGRKHLKRLLQLEVSIFLNGADPYKLSFDGELINKFFYPIQVHLDSKSYKSLALSYDRKTKEDSLGEIRTQLIYELFTTNSFKINPNGLDSFNEVDAFLAKRIRLTDSLEKQLQNAYESVIPWVRMYSYLFKKLKPKMSLGLCYYSMPMFGMCIASKRHGVISVDLQHGLQGEMAIPYSFEKSPESGYNSLPHEFWCWDESTVVHLNQWANSYHKIKKSGNPWIEYLIKNRDKFSQQVALKKPMVLYTCMIRPSPVIDQYLIDAINKTSNDFEWWIRLHPRADEKMKIELINILERANLLNKVNINLASELPLQSILLKCHLHISKYSGAVLESIIQNVPTIVLEKIGITSYREFIESGQVIGLESPVSDDIVKEIRNYSGALDKTESVYNLEKFLEMNINIDGNGLS